MQNDSNLETPKAEIPEYLQCEPRKTMSNYQCNCGGLALPDFDSYKVDDEVNFMIQKRKRIGNGEILVNQKAHHGKITKIDGDDITVKATVRVYVLSRYEITPKDAPGPIEYFRLGKCRCELDQQRVSA